MLHKALLASPKEFRISIGTQTYCAASVNKSRAMPGDLVTVTVRSNTGYGNVKVAVSPSVEVTKGECQDCCVWGGYSRGSPTRLPFPFCDVVCQT